MKNFGRTESVRCVLSEEYAISVHDFAYEVAIDYEKRIEKVLWRAAVTLDVLTL